MGGSSTIRTTENKILSMSLQSSAYGVPIPVVFGQTRVAGNLIYYNDFTATAHTTTTGSGGKGGGVSQSNTAYTYSATVMMGLCVGPINSIQACWADKEKFLATDARFTSYFSLFTGAFGQSRWGWLTTNHPGDDFPYSGVAYIASNNYDAGSTGTLKNHTWEVRGLLPFNAPTIVDANPADIVKTMLTDAMEGVGFPSGSLGDFTTAGQFSTWCVSNGLFLSGCFDQQKAARQIIAEVAAAVNCDFVWSSGLLKPVSYGDATVTGNGATFTPNLTPVYNLTDDDFISSGKDPITITRSANADAHNWTRVKFKDRLHDYNDAIAEAKDSANIDLYGVRQAPDYDCPWITTQIVARQVAQFLLNRALYVRNRYAFKLSWRYILLEPMDLVTLTDSGLGLSQKTVRITSIGEDEHGLLSIEAEEWPFGIATPALFTVGGGTGYAPNQNAAPPSANAPMLFEPPLGMTNGAQEVWLATSAGGINWGGANIWVSQDAAVYEMVGVSYGSRHGVLSASFASATDPDTTNTCAVDLTVSGAALASSSASDYAALLTQCWVAANTGGQGEVINYQTATLTATSKYNLTTMRRGMYGTPVAAHNSGNAFVRLDAGIFEIPMPPNMIGKTIYIKLQSFNSQGGGVQALAGLTAYSYVVQGNGAGSIAAPSGVTLTIQDTPL